MQTPAITPSIPSGLTTLPSCLRQATVSRGSIRASVRKRHVPCAVSKLANGKKPTGLFARKHLLAPYTGEAIVKMTPSAPSGHLPQRGRQGELRNSGNYSLSLAASINLRSARQLPQTHPKKILRLFLGTPREEPREMTASGLNNPSGLPLASFRAARHRLGGARETPPRSGNAPNNGAFPSSQVVKATPWLCQERTCSPLTQGRLQ